MEREGFDAAAADRRRDDLARAHGGQDRAALRRARRSGCPTRRARVGVCSSLLSRRAARGLRRRRSRPTTSSIRAQHAGKKGPTLVSLGARARERVQDRLDSATRRRSPTMLGRARCARTTTSPRSRSSSTGGRSSRRGSSPGRIPAILDDPVVGEAARNVLAEGQAMLEEDRRRPLAHGERRRSASCPRTRVGDETSRSTPTSRASSVLMTWHNLRQQNEKPAGQAEPVPRRLRRAEGLGRAPTTSAPSR